MKTYKLPTTKVIRENFGKKVIEKYDQKIKIGYETKLYPGEKRILGFFRGVKSIVENQYNIAIKDGKLVAELDSFRSSISLEQPAYLLQIMYDIISSSLSKKDKLILSELIAQKQEENQ